MSLLRDQGTSVVTVKHAVELVMLAAVRGQDGLTTPEAAGALWVVWDCPSGSAGRRGGSSGGKPSAWFSGSDCSTVIP